MKNTKNIEKYTDKEWEELASCLSDEQIKNKDLVSSFMAEDDLNTVKNWKESGMMNNDKEIDVDKAWNKVFTRLREEEPETVKPAIQRSIMRSTWMRIAAVAVVILGLGALLIYVDNKGLLSKNIEVATTENQKNLQVTLPDGSVVILNRETQLSYRENFGKYGRNVTLKGEAFFKITHDAENPFTVETENAKVRVLGTSFNVITNNDVNAVEVYVETGKVMVSDNTGEKNLTLDPGYVGTIDHGNAGKKPNEDPNYLSWNTGLLVYDGQTLDVVFRDLKRVYNMDIVADNPEILKNTWTTPTIDNLPEDIIIRLICTSFNLSYTKDGNVYHLTEE